MRCLVSSLSIVATLAVATVAHAQPGVTPPVASPPAERPPSAMPAVMASDAATIALIVGGIEAQSGWPALVGITSFFLTPPIIHNAYGDGLAGRSVGLRLGLTGGGLVAGLMVGAIAERDSCGEFCGLGTLFGGAVGFGAGGITAMLIDWGSSARPRARRRTAVVPLAVRGAGAGVGLAGEF